MSATASNSLGVTFPDDVTLTIRDDDDPPTVTLHLSPDTISEAGGTSTATASLSHPSGLETTVTVSVVPVSPAVAGDYTLSSNVVLTIAAGAMDSTGTVTVTAVDNDVDAPDKEVTVWATTTNAHSGSVLDSAPLTIEDDDNAAPTGAVTIDDTTPVVGETLTADASNVDDPNGLTNRSFTWQWIRVSGGTETDLAGATTASYTVADADVGATLKVRVGFTDDEGTEETVESAETAVVEALPRPVVAVAPVASPVAEGEDAQFRVTRTGVTAGALTVAYRVSETGAMVAPGEEGAKSVDFGDGDTEQTVTVPTVEDTVHVADSTVTVTLTPDAAYDLGTATAEVTVTDDDNAAPTGAPTIDDTTPVVGQTLTVDPSGIDDPDGLTGATYAWRWLRVASGGGETEVGTGSSYVVAAGDVGARLKVEASFTDDGGTAETVESAETAVVAVALPVLSIGDSSVDEGDSDDRTTLYLTVTLSRAWSGPVTVRWSTADGTATAGRDYTAGNGSLTFGAGETGKTVSVSVTGDEVDEPDETFTVRLSSPSGATIGDGTATGTITDDDDAPAVTLVLTPDSIEENGGLSTVTARLDRPSSEATTVTVTVTPVLPAVADDYTLSANPELTVAAGETESTGAVTVTAVDNAVDAPDKVVMVSATAANPQGVTAPEDVTLTIVDDDEPVLSIDDASVDEGDSGSTTMQFTVMLDPSARGEGDGGLGERRRDGDGGDGLHGGERKPDVQRRRDQQDGDGIGDGRPHGRAGRDPHGDAVEPVGRDHRGCHGDRDDRGRRRPADGDAGPDPGHDRGERWGEHGDGASGPPVERGDDGDGVGHPGVAGGGGRLHAEREPGADDRGGCDDEHGGGDDCRCGQRRGGAGQGGDGVGHGDERPGGHGPGGRDADDQGRRSHRRASTQARVRAGVVRSHGGAGPGHGRRGQTGVGGGRDDGDACGDAAGLVPVRRGHIRGAAALCRP